jgi:Glutathione S-transferase, N-terminal domain
MMKLYGFPPTRSIRVLWTLRELGVDFELVEVNLMAGENRRPEFLALNPAGKLPVLVDGDFVLTESVAIDFVAAYTLDWANEVHLVDASPLLRDYMEQMYARPKAPPRIAEALASVRSR